MEGLSLQGLTVGKLDSPAVSPLLGPFSSSNPVRNGKTPPVVARKGVTSPNGRPVSRRPKHQDVVPGKKVPVPVPKSKAAVTQLQPMGLQIETNSAQQEQQSHALLRQAQAADEKKKNHLGSSVFSRPVSPYDVMEASLVENLRKQISCMESQIDCLKQQLHRRESTLNSPLLKREPEGNSHSASSVMPSSFYSSSPLMPLPSTVPTMAPPERVGMPVENAKSMTNKPSIEKSDVPESYWSALCAVEFNLDCALVEHSRLQSLVHQEHQEKMELVRKLSELQRKNDALEDDLSVVKKERESALEKVMTAQQDVVNLEQSLALLSSEEGKNVASDSGKETAVKTLQKLTRFEDMMHQRDYFKLQAERLEAGESVLEAQVAALRKCAAEERENAAHLRVELRAALDRLSLEDSRRRSEMEHFKDLGKRFVSMAALLRKVVDGRRAALRKAAAGKTVHDEELEEDAISLEKLLSDQHSIQLFSSVMNNVVPPSTAAAPPVTIPQAALETVPQPPAVAVPTPPPAEAVPQPPAVAIPTPPPAEAVPQAPAVAIPTPPPAEPVPQPPAVAIPTPPPAETVPQPPAVAIPTPPPAETVPQPPAVAIPTPPPAEAVPQPPAVAVPTLGGCAVPAAPSKPTEQEELAALNNRINEAEEELRKLLAAEGVEGFVCGQC